MSVMSRARRSASSSVSVWACMSADVWTDWSDGSRVSGTACVGSCSVFGSLMFSGDSNGRMSRLSCIPVAKALRLMFLTMIAYLLPCSCFYSSTRLISDR